MSKKAAVLSEEWEGGMVTGAGDVAGAAYGVDATQQQCSKTHRSERPTGGWNGRGRPTDDREGETRREREEGQSFLFFHFPIPTVQKPVFSQGSQPAAEPELHSNRFCPPPSSFSSSTASAADGVVLIKGQPKWENRKEGRQ